MQIMIYDFCYISGAQPQIEQHSYKFIDSAI